MVLPLFSPPHRAPPHPPAGTNKAPRFAGLFTCAEEDSNLHGPFSPQGPQLCPHLTFDRCIAELSQIRPAQWTVPPHSARRLFPPVFPRGRSGDVITDPSRTLRRTDREADPRSARCRH